MKLSTAVRSMLWCSDERFVLKNTLLGLRVARLKEHASFKQSTQVTVIPMGQ